jgi:intracellular sulfur oxidation DsrE/DsrF family protein
MNRRIALAALLAALLPLHLHSQEAKKTQQPQGKYRVVFQVSDNDPAKWKLALNNAYNVQEDLGKENVQIEIVAYGPGLAMLKAESPVAGGLADAMDRSVRLLACENTMTNMKIDKADMYGGIAYVHAGVTHLMKRQRERWAYIRP